MAIYDPHKANIAGYKDVTKNLFTARRKDSKLCDNCLIEEILREFDKYTPRPRKK